jgi:hypothetical protein
MGMTIEFYSANEEELVALFSSMDGDDETFFGKLDTYPMADFPFHLLIPEDLDGLCQALRKQNSLVQPTFEKVLTKQIWYDGTSESLTLLDQIFVVAIAGLSDEEIEKVTLDWMAAFPPQQPARQTPTYNALTQLRDVAQDALAHQKKLILHLLGNPAFLRW